MPNWLVDALKTVVPGVVVGVITAAVTLKFAIKRFRQEKWWERKEQSYAQLLDTLHHLKCYASKHLETYHEQSTNKETKELEAIWKEYSSKLDRLEDLASFQLSPRAVEILANYRKRNKAARSENTYDSIEEDLAATIECLDALKREAKIDLKLG